MGLKPTAAALDRAELIGTTDMTAPVIQRFAGGTLAYFTRRSPDKETENEDAIGFIPWVITAVYSSSVMASVDYRPVIKHPFSPFVAWPTTLRRHHQVTIVCVKRSSTASKRPIKPSARSVSVPQPPLR